jgi:carbonic anhydrase
VISSESLASLYRSAHGEPASPPVLLTILTCMDTRLRPEGSLGMSVGEAHVIRNAGGRASDDAVRSLVIAWKELGVDEVVIVHHSECRMTTFTDEELRQDLAGQWSINASAVDFLAFTDPHDSVRVDVERIRESPLVPDFVAVSGCVSHTDTGRLEVVVADPVSRIPMFATASAV